MNELIINGQNITAHIMDEEGDVIECVFMNDGCVQLNTEEYTYLTLSEENLETLIRLTDEAELTYPKILK